MSHSLQTFSRWLRAPLHLRKAQRRLREFHAAPHGLEETIELAMNFGGRGLYRVKTLQVRSEILALARAVEALNPKNILEIGTARGGTLLIWAQLASERVVTCDLFPRRGLRRLLSDFPPPGSRCRIIERTGDSHDARFRQQVIDAFEGEAIDFLFIDGDHSSEGVEADYVNYASLVRPGGLIAFHDIAEHQAISTNEVHTFWKRLKPTVRSTEIIEDSNQIGCGIGLVHVQA